MLTIGFMGILTFLNNLRNGICLFNYYFSNLFFFDFKILENIFLLSIKKTYLYFFFLPSIYYYYLKSDFLIFLFLNKLKFFSFIKNILNGYFNLSNVFFFRLRLRGLGFYTRRISKSFLCFFMALNHFFFFHLNSFIFLKKKKKRFIFISFFKDKLNVLFWNLMFLKKHNVYVKIKGIGGFIKPNLVRFIRNKKKV